MIQVQAHECIQRETIGKMKEFMDSVKGFRITIFTMIVTIILQVGTFLFLWGGLTTTVAKNTDYLWNVISPATLENTRNIDKILAKFELIHVIQGAQGAQGPQGHQGIQGVQGEKGL